MTKPTMTTRIDVRDGVTPAIAAQIVGQTDWPRNVAGLIESNAALLTRMARLEYQMQEHMHYYSDEQGQFRTSASCGQRFDSPFEQLAPVAAAQPVTFAPGWHCRHCNTSIPGGQYHDCENDAAHLRAMAADQPAGDDAAVEKMAQVINSCDAGDGNNLVGVSAHDECYTLNRYTSRRIAPQILAAIRRGEIPTICGDNDANALARRLALDLSASEQEVAVLRARLAEAELAASERLAMKRADYEPRTTAECREYLDEIRREYGDSMHTGIFAVAHNLMAERDRLAAQVAELDGALEVRAAEARRQCEWKAQVEAERDKALADLAEAYASLDMQRKSNERARARYDTAHPDEAGKWPDRTDMVAWMMEDHDKLAALLRYALPFIQHCNDCGSYRDSDAAPLMGRIDAALAEYGCDELLGADVLPEGKPSGAI